MSTPPLDPPPRRALPPAARARLRQELGSLSMQSPPSHDHRRAFLPWLGAACVAAVVVGAVWWTAPGRQLTAVPGAGYGAATTSVDELTSPATDPDPGPRASGPRWVDDGRPVSVAEERAAFTPAQRLADPTSAYATCVALVRDSPSTEGDPGPAPTGRLAVSNGLATTVVVANASFSWTCNLSPDHAVSPRSSLTSPAPIGEPSTWAVAVNASLNYWVPPIADCTAPRPSEGPGSALGDGSCYATASTMPGMWSGSLLWVGGRLPAGVSGLTYVLPDGRSIPAVVADGWWVVQDVSPTYWMAAGGTVPAASMTVRLSDGRSVVLPLGPETLCHQATHGC